MFLDNFKIRTKIIGVILLMTLVSIAGLIFVSARFKAADTQYSDFIANDALATVLNARTSGNLAAIGMQLNRIVLNEPGSEFFETLVKIYRNDRAQLEERQRKIVELVPARAQASRGIMKGVVELEDIGNQVIALMQEGRRAEAQQMAATASLKVSEVSPKISRGNEDLIQAMSVGSDMLTASTNSTIAYSLGVFAGMAVAVICLGFYISTFGITGPIEKLRARMLSLAGGETQEAHDNRSLAENERVTREAQRADEAAEVDFASRQIAG
ncbi:MAG: methyl-accepting chemotaxis protein, partial [Rhizobium pusense]|nr:methyl-accepting chemotaxis protein [Agrobacterium pusense]